LPAEGTVPARQKFGLLTLSAFPKKGGGKRGGYHRFSKSVIKKRWENERNYMAYYPYVWARAKKEKRKKKGGKKKRFAETLDVLRKKKEGEWTGSNDC